MPFYYYGRKKALGRRYPKALHETIVEPFAGSAAYACRPENRGKRVILVEKDPWVIDLWLRLQSSTPEQILAMPDLAVGDQTSDFMHIVHAASKRAFEYRRITVTKVLAANWACAKPAMAELVPFVKNWTIIEGDYTDAPDIEATWFIDPPYQGPPGTGYRHGSDSIDYQDLGRWCESRTGQVIVCEGGGADWLPFEPLVAGVGVAGKRNIEQVYLR